MVKLVVCGGKGWGRGDGENFGFALPFLCFALSIDALLHASLRAMEVVGDSGIQTRKSFLEPTSLWFGLLAFLSCSKPSGVSRLQPGRPSHFPVTGTLRGTGAKTWPWLGYPPGGGVPKGLGVALASLSPMLGLYASNISSELRGRDGSCQKLLIVAYCVGVGVGRLSLAPA